MKCDELNWFYAYPILFEEDKHIKVYSKSEVDEAIAELKQQLRKQKRERCLAMAKACNLMLVLRHSFPHKKYIQKWFERCNKWIDLADKFKEAKFLHQSKRKRMKNSSCKVDSVKLY